jgi:hypothetical protein
MQQRNHDEHGAGLIRDAVKLVGSQSKLASLSDVSQSCLSIALQSGRVTVKLLRLVAKGIKRRKAGKPLAERLDLHAQNRAVKN